MADATEGRIITPGIVTAKQNAVNLQRVVDNWMLGPDKASPKPVSYTHLRAHET
jgi:hypothetical protein